MPDKQDKITQADKLNKLKNQREYLYTTRYTEKKNKVEFV